MRRSPHRRSRPRNSVRRQAPRPRSSMRGSWAIPATDGKWISQRFPDNLRADDGSTMTNPCNIPAFKRPSRHLGTYVPKLADVSHERRQLVRGRRLPLQRALPIPGAHGERDGNQAGGRDPSSRSTHSVRRPTRTLVPGQRHASRAHEPWLLRSLARAFCLPRGSSASPRHRLMTAPNDSLRMIAPSLPLPAALGVLR